MKCVTTLKGNNYKNILDSVIGQISDGIWENTPNMQRYWGSLDIETNPDGYLVISDSDNVCKNPLEFMANKIKQIIKIEIEDGEEQLKWDRNCSEYSCYLDAPVNECYYVYDTLKGRNTKKFNY